MEKQNYVQAGTELKQLINHLVINKENLNLKRRATFLGIHRITEEIEALITDKKTEIEIVIGKTKKIVNAFKIARINVLIGALENFLSSYEGNPYSIPDNEKTNILLKEQSYLLDGHSIAEINERYSGLIPTLDNTCGEMTTGVTSHLNIAIGDWIHSVQSSFKLVSVKNQATVLSHPRVKWDVYKRIFSIVTFRVKDDNSFTCTIKMSPLIDQHQREITFTNDTVAANFQLPEVKS